MAENHANIQQLENLYSCQSEIGVVCSVPMDTSEDDVLYISNEIKQDQPLQEIKPEDVKSFFESQNGSLIEQCKPTKLQADKLWYQYCIDAEAKREQIRSDRAKKRLSLEREMFLEKEKEEKQKMRELKDHWNYYTIRKIPTKSSIHIDYFKSKESPFEDSELKLDWFYFKDYKVIAVSEKKMMTDYLTVRQELFLNENHYEYIKNFCLHKMRMKFETSRKVKKGGAVVMMQGFPCEINMK